MAAWTMALLGDMILITNFSNLIINEIKPINKTMYKFCLIYYFCLGTQIKNFVVVMSKRLITTLY